MAKMNISNLRNLQFSDSGQIRFTADDELRGESEFVISDPCDSKALAEFCVEFLTVMQAGVFPEELGYLRIA